MFWNSSPLAPSSTFLAGRIGVPSFMRFLSRFGGTLAADKREKLPLLNGLIRYLDGGQLFAGEVLVEAEPGAVSGPTRGNLVTTPSRGLRTSVMLQCYGAGAP